MKKSMILTVSVLVAFFSVAQPTPDSKAVFTFSSLKDTVRFFSQPDSGQETARHVWLFGDGRISTDNNPVHIYSECGVYKVKHFRMLLDTAGAVVSSDSSLTEVRTNCPLICKTEPNFKWQQYIYDPFNETTLSRSSVLFTNTTPGDLPKGAKVRWLVDGQPYSSKWSPWIHFPYGGYFTVCLRITLPNGCVVERCERIGVAEY
jgi:hypothetical protein